MVSSDLEEILSLSDRIIVMYEGRITGTMNAEDANENNIGMLMMGGNPEDAKKSAMRGDGTLL